MDLLEGGIRVPYIVRWPAVVKPGGVSAQHCLTMDWSATLLAAAGVAPHADYPLDGVSLLPVLRDAGASFPRPMLWRMNHRGQRACRDGDWKYLRVDGNDYLFDIATTNASAPTALRWSPSGCSACAPTGKRGTRRCRRSPRTPPSAWAIRSRTCRSAECVVGSAMST